MRARKYLGTLKRLAKRYYRLEQAASLIWHYPGSVVGAYRHRHDVEDLETFCLFVGYPRSGHSLVGSLLDAHPHVIVAHEQHILRYLRAGYRRNQLFSLLLENSQHATRVQQGAADYSYRVSNQYQGRFTSLRVIGDKGAWGATLALQKRPDLLEKLHQRTGLPVKLIHVVRNPFDTISRMAEREEIDIAAAADHYFQLCDTVETIRKQVAPATYHEVKHELLIDAPEHELASLCAHLNLTASVDYLRDCSAILFKTPHKSRSEVNWEPSLVQWIQDRASQFPFLAHYQFDD